MRILNSERVFGRLVLEGCARTHPRRPLDLGNNYMKNDMPMDIQDHILRKFHVSESGMAGVATMRPRRIMIRGRMGHMKLMPPQAGSQDVILVHFRFLEKTGSISQNNHTVTIETITNWTYGFSTWDRFHKFLNRLPYQMPVCGASNFKLRDSNGIDVSDRAFKVSLSTDFVHCDL